MHAFVLPEPQANAAPVAHESRFGAGDIGRAFAGSSLEAIKAACTAAVAFCAAVFVVLQVAQ